MEYSFCTSAWSYFSVFLKIRRINECNIFFFLFRKNLRACWSCRGLRAGCFILSFHPFRHRLQVYFHQSRHLYLPLGHFIGDIFLRIFMAPNLYAIYYFSIRSNNLTSLMSWTSSPTRVHINKENKSSQIHSSRRWWGNAKWPS